MYRDEEKKFDIRVLQKHIPSEEARREEIFTYLNSLPDVSSKIDTGYAFNFTMLPGSPKNEPEETAEGKNTALSGGGSSEAIS